MQFSDLYGTFLDRELGSADRTVLFTTARRQLAVNEAVLEFNRLTECYCRLASVSLSDATGEYDLQTVISASDYVRVAKQGIELSIVTGTQTTSIAGDHDFPRQTIEWLNRFRPGWRSEPSGTPDAHYLRTADAHVYLGLVPAPSLPSGTTGTALVPYVAVPATLSNDTDVPFTVGGVTLTALVPYHRAIGHLAASFLERFRRDTQAEAVQVQKATGYITDYLGAQARPKGRRQVQTTTQYFRNARGHGGWWRRDPYRWP